MTTAGETRSRAGVVAVILAFSAPPAVADAVIEGGTLTVPLECNRFIPGRTDAPTFWGRWLSLAACLQPDASVAVVSDRAELAPMVKELTIALVPSMMLYREALGHAPPQVQLYAAYHVGLLAVAMVTRARSAVPTRALGAPLETLLEPAKSTARTAFTVISSAADEDPTLEDDPVTHEMVGSARVLLRALGEEPPHLDGQQQASAW